VFGCPHCTRTPLVLTRSRLCTRPPSRHHVGVLTPQALEHLGEPLSSYPFRLLRLCGLLSLVGAKAIATPLYLRATLSTRPELHQPAMLPRKLVTAADAALSVGWLASHFALHKAYRRWRHGLPSVVAPRLLAAAGGAAHQLRLQARSLPPQALHGPCA